jgi:hypothetical protein
VHRATECQGVMVPGRPSPARVAPVPLGVNGSLAKAPGGVPECVWARLGHPKAGAAGDDPLQSTVQVKVGTERADSRHLFVLVLSDEAVSARTSRNVNRSGLCEWARVQ